MKMDTQDILLGLLTELRNYEASDEDDKQAEADAVLAVVLAKNRLFGIGWHGGDDGKAHKRGEK
jgi:hypothetical protein